MPSRRSKSGGERLQWNLYGVYASTRVDEDTNSPCRLYGGPSLEIIPGFSWARLLLFSEHGSTESPIGNGPKWASDRAKGSAAVCWRCHLPAPGYDQLGVVEGLNDKAKVSMRKSNGFRTYRVLELALYRSLGKLPEP